MELSALQSIFQSYGPATEALYHHPSLGLIVMDLQHRYVLVNPIAAQYLAQSSAELEGQSHFQAFPDALHHNVFPTLVDEQWVTYTQRRPRSSAFDALDCWEVSIALSRDRDGVGNGYLLLVHETSSFRRAVQEAVRQREEFYTLLEAVPAGVLLAQGAEGQVIRMNDMAVRIFGESLTVGTRIAKTSGKQHPLVHAIRTGDHVEGAKYEFTREDGRSLTVLMDCAPLGLWNNKRTAIAVIHDISGFAEHERELETQNRWLREVDQAKDNFLANVSHELKTPLTAILGWVNLAREVATTDIMQQALEVVERSARRQAWMIEDLLTLSNCFAGRMALRPKRVTIRSVCEEALTRAYRVLPEGSMAITVDVAAELTCYLDAQRIAHALGNVLSNALKFTPQGGSIVLTAIADGNWVQVDVRDTGIGIAPENLPSLFNPFWQGDSSITRKYSGAGIGLSVVKELVERHGGEVRAASAGQEQGAQFTIRLPKDGPPK